MASGAVRSILSPLLGKKTRSVLILCHAVGVINDAWDIGDAKNGIKYSLHKLDDLNYRAALAGHWEQGPYSIFLSMQHVTLRRDRGLSKSFARKCKSTGWIIGENFRFQYRLVVFFLTNFGQSGPHRCEIDVHFDGFRFR